MAPTEVLAEQHAALLRRLLTGFTIDAEDSLFGARDLAVELLTNRTTAAERRRHPRGARGGLGPLAGRHPRVDPGGGALLEARRRRDRRAAPLRGRAAGGAARGERRRHRSRRAGDDGHADPAHGGDDGLRRPRRVDHRRAPSRPHPDRDELGAQRPRGGRDVGRPCGRRWRPVVAPTSCARWSRSPRSSRSRRRPRPSNDCAPTSSRGWRWGCCTGGCRRPTRTRSWADSDAASSTCSSRRR